MRHPAFQELIDDVLSEPDFAARRAKAGSWGSKWFVGTHRFKAVTEWNAVNKTARSDMEDELKTMTVLDLKDMVHIEEVSPAGSPIPSARNLRHFQSNLFAIKPEAG